MNQLSRDILPEDFTFDGNTKEEFCKHINRWKTLLISRGAKRGDLVAHSIIETNINHMSAIFAVAELGMRLLIIDKPVSVDTIHKTKMGIFGPVDFTLECDTAKEMPNHHEMVKRYSKQIISEEEYKQWDDDRESLYLWGDDLKFLLASTSGTTDTTKPVWFTQNEVYEMSLRNTSIFKFEKESRVLHYRNMHHASALLTYIFPSFLGSSFHVSCAGCEDDLGDVFEHYVIPLRVDRLIAANIYEIARLLASTIKKEVELNHTVLINVSGFTVTKQLLKIVNDHDIELISHYGSIDTGIPLLVNHVAKPCSFDDGFLGIQPDDFYGMEIRDGLTYVTSKFWESERIISDYLELRDNKWYHRGRIDADPLQEYVNTISNDAQVVSVDGIKYLVLWEEHDHTLFNKIDFEKIFTLDRETFTVDTKVNMDQLREYIRNKVKTK